MLQQQTPYVVVVDDERVIAETLSTILNSSGFTAKYFINPLEALESARTEPPELLISDIMMPQLSGIDLAMRLRAQCPSCNILLFSGQTDTADLLTPPRARGHDFPVLLKPVHPSILLRTIREQERSWLIEPLVSSPIAFRSIPETPILSAHYRPRESDPTKKGSRRDHTDSENTRDQEGV
jgi:DNA-binding response OmpR family regulator